jgi:hypothetical protein
MKAPGIILSLLLLFANAKAQEHYRFSGRVVDSLTSQPVPFTSISLFTQQKTSFKNVIADSLGQFVFTGLPVGRYYLAINVVGYRKFISQPISLPDTSLDRPVLYRINRDTGLLAAVVVQANKPLITPSADGFAYNAANDVIPAGSTASDLLRKVPLLSVDQNGSPVLRGSSNIRVYIDDKPSDIYAVTVADALKQIPADDIVRIEVILYPSAKYDAEGTDGVINIITRKSRFNAINGNLRAQTGNIRHAITPDLNIRQGNWIVNSNTGLYYYDSDNSATLTREGKANNPKDRLQQQREWYNQGRSGYAGANIIYVFNDLQSISGGYRYRFNRDYNNGNTYNDYYLQDTLFTAFKRYTGSASGNDLHTFNMAYNGKSRDRKRQYSLLATQFFQTATDAYDLDQVDRQATDYKEIFRGSITNKELLLQADYAHQVNDSISWDAGIKSMFRQYSNLNNVEVFNFPAGLFGKDEGRSNWFNYHRNIYAVYSNLSFRWVGWQWRVGARYEQTVLQTNFKDTGLAVPDYRNFVPNILLSRTFRGKHTIKGSYGKRITRPFLGAINPASNYSDSFNIQTGNPYLLPEVTHRYEIGYTRNGKQGSVMASIYYNRTGNAIEQVRLPLGNGIFQTTYRNIGKNEVVGLSVSLSGKWQQKLSITITGNIRHITLESVALQQERKGYQYSAGFYLSYIMGKGFSLDAMGNAGSPDIALQGRREVWQYYGLAFNKKFKGDKLSINLRADNFLQPRFVGLKQTLETATFIQHATTYYQARYLALSISWKLGKKEVKAPAVRQETGSEN